MKTKSQKSNGAKQSSPNILFIMTDQQRYDTLKVNGNPIMETPNLDTLAAQGLRFTNAYTTCTLCSPARASIFTGRYAFHHGLRTNTDMGEYSVKNLADEEKLVSDFLKEKNYNLGYFGKWHLANDKGPHDYGFEGMNEKGYGRIWLNKDYLSSIKENNFEAHYDRWIDKDEYVWKGGLKTSTNYYLSEVTIELMRKFAKDRKEKGKPFFLTCQFWGPHVPYLPLKEFAEKYRPEDMVLWENFYDDFSGKPQVQQIRHKLTFNPEALFFASFHNTDLEKKYKKLIARYLALNTEIDFMIGRILNELKELCLEQDTLVAFTTDHGDSIGSHGFYDKGPFMYEETYHIPFIIRWPKVIEPNRACDNFVYNMDIMPTVLELAGIEIPENIDAQSLVPLFYQDKVKDWRSYALLEFHGHEILFSQRGLRYKNYKYVYNSSNIDELYDLEKDPHELKNLINDNSYNTVKAELQQRLIKAAEKANDTLVKEIRMCTEKDTQ